MTRCSQKVFCLVVTEKVGRKKGKTKNCWPIARAKENQDVETLSAAGDEAWQGVGTQDI